MKPNLKIVTRDDVEPRASAYCASVSTVAGFRRERPRPIVDAYRKVPDRHAHLWASQMRVAPRASVEVVRNASAQTEVEARELLSLGDDWDGEGARGIVLETVDRAISLFQSVLVHGGLGLLSQLASPSVSPLSNGSIDLYWKSDAFTLLINIPAETSGYAEFYGSNLSTGYDVRGRIRMDGPDLRFLGWLVN